MTAAVPAHAARPSRTTLWQLVGLSRASYGADALRGRATGGRRLHLRSSGGSIWSRSLGCLVKKALRGRVLDGRRLRLHSPGGFSWSESSGCLHACGADALRGRATGGMRLHLRSPGGSTWSGSSGCLPVFLRTEEEGRSGCG